MFVEADSPTIRCARRWYAHFRSYVAFAAARVELDSWAAGQRLKGVI